MDRATVHQRRWRILAVLCLSLIIIGMDNLILSLALPSVQQDLQADGSQLQWIVDSYTLAFGGLLLLGGGLGDRFGRRLMLLAGLTAVLGFSIGAAYAGSAEMLIAMRAGMGVGGAFVMPATLSIIKDVFPREEQAKAISVWAGSGAIGVPLGPVLGGLLLENYWWGSVFLLAVPVVLAAIIAVLAIVPESRNPGRTKFDLVGVLLSVGGLGALVYGLIEAPHYGWDDPLPLSIMAGGVLGIVLFVLWEKKSSAPMLPPSLFRSPAVGGSAVAMFCVNFCLFGLLFGVSQYFQFVNGHGPLASGLRLLPVLTAIAGAPMGQKLAEKFGLRFVAVVGLIVLAASMVTMAAADGAGESLVLVALALFGFTMGFTIPACANTILASAPDEQGGAASGLTDATLQVGGSLGIAVMGSVLATSYRDGLPNLVGVLPPEASAAVQDSLGGANEVARRIGGDSGHGLMELVSPAFVSALTDAMLVGGAVAVGGVLVAALLLPSRKAQAVANTRPEHEIELPISPTVTLPARRPVGSVSEER